MTDITAKEEGREAFRKNYRLSDNPYRTEDEMHNWWHEGWKEEWWSKVRSNYESHAT